jgi:molecular chaperone GrpE
MGFTDRFNKKNKDSFSSDVDENQKITAAEDEANEMILEDGSEIKFTEAHGLAEEVIKLKAEIEELKKRNELMLRVIADKDNQMKASAEFAKKDIQIAKDDYAKKFIGEVASEFENLFRAIQEMSEKFGDASCVILNNTVERIKNAFNKVGVEFIKPQLGEESNPEMHNILTSVQNSDLQDGQILDIISSCWKVGGKVVKCADVVVVKN